MIQVVRSLDWAGTTPAGVPHRGQNRPFVSAPHAVQ
jgi:hypothetical protein